MTKRHENALIFTTLAAFALITAQAAEADLQSYYNFDSNVTDQAGPNNGTINGSNTAYLSSFTGFGNAIQFGGNPGADNTDTYVSLANESNFDYSTTDPRDNFSISFWFDNQGSWDDQWEAVVVKGEGNRWRLHRNSNSNNLNWHTTNNANSTTNFNNSDWHHVVVSFLEGVSTEVFVDGVKETTGGAPGNLQETNNQVRIGSNSEGAGDRFLSGLIDDMAFWNNPDTAGATDPGLTDGESIALYTLGIQSELTYTVNEADQLFQLHRSGSGSIVVDGLLWMYGSGTDFSGFDGSLTGSGSEFFLVLDAAGDTGLLSTVIPEPSTFAMAFLGLTGLGLATWRRRRNR